MRIGVVCPYDIGKPGGVQQLTAELAAQLRARGDDVVYVGAGRSWFPGGPGLDDVTIPAGRAISVRANRSQAPLSLSPIPWRRVRRALSSVDVVHVHEPLVPLVGWMALSCDRPLVATFHADAPAWASTLYDRMPGIGRRLRSSTLTAVSATAARALPERWGRVRIIPNAVDVPSYRVPAGRVERRVAFLGRDDPRKGLSVLLDAWPAVHEAVPGAELIVMGSDRASELPGVRFMGPVSGGEKRRLLATSQVFVAPNLGGESFGIVVVEAMAAGCAVVTTDIPAFVEVAGDAAVHVPAGDAAALGEAVASLLLDGKRAHHLAGLSSRRAEDYDWPRVVEMYRAVYAETASS